MEQEIVYEKLPTDIADRFVLLMDPILGSGGSATRAVNVLLSKGVDEGKILFLRWLGCGRAAGWRACRASLKAPAFGRAVAPARLYPITYHPLNVPHLCSLIAAPEGIHTLCRRFPRIKVRTRHIPTLARSGIAAGARGSQLLAGPWSPPSRRSAPLPCTLPR
jgi:uridine kinase